MDAPHQGAPELAGEARLLPEALGRLGPEELLVNEFFLSIQGESTRAGRPCFFIRLAGCHLRCSWCDTRYAFHEGSVHTVETCVERARAASVPLVEVTGGEPLLQEAAFTLLERLADEGLEVLVETSGAVPIARLSSRIIRIVDVKCPASGMAARNLSGIERDLRARDELKFVIADRGDYLWAKGWIEARTASLPPGIPIHFSPASGRLSLCRPEELAAWVLEDRLPVRLGLQIHKVLWGERRGV